MNSNRQRRRAVCRPVGLIDSLVLLELLGRYLYWGGVGQGEGKARNSSGPRKLNISQCDRESARILSISRWSLEVLNTILTRFVRNRDSGILTIRATETMLAEAMLADLRARAARVCWCELSLPTGGLHLQEHHGTYHRTVKLCWKFTLKSIGKCH